MAAPTIASRLARRCIAASSREDFRAAARAALPADWTLAGATMLREVGDFAEVLQHRFVLLDLDDAGARDPVAVVDEARRELMLNIPIFCFGGDGSLRDRARVAGADRFFGDGDLAARIRDLCEQYGW